MQIATLISSIITGLCALYLIFFRSYLSEKGKNLATKEDIEEITRKVENIKSEIQFTTNSKFTLKKEERDSLVNCYEKYFVWLTLCVESYFSHYDSGNEAKLDEIASKLETSRLNYIHALGKLELFLNNEEISRFFYDLNIKTLEIQNVDSEFILNRVHFIQRKIFANKIGDLEERRKELKALTEAENDEYRKFIDKRLDLYRKLAPLNTQMQNLINKHIQSHLVD